MSSSFPIEKASTVIPKLIAKYKLDLTEQQRKTIRRRGEPTWTFVLNYDSGEVGILKLWLFTTGFSQNPRKKLIILMK